MQCAGSTQHLPLHIKGHDRSTGANFHNSADTRFYRQTDRAVGLFVL